MVLSARLFTSSLNGYLIHRNVGQCQIGNKLSLKSENLINMKICFPKGLPCPANYNPADFYIYNLAVVPGQEKASRKKIEEICNAYELSDDGSSIAQLLKINRNSFGDETTLLMQQNRSPYKANWWTQFTAVLWRSWVSIVKDPRVPVVEGISARVRSSLS